MRAAVLVNSREPLVLADLKVPVELSYGQVHVKICYSGLCGAQINEIDAAKGPDKFLPHLLGHEGSGKVLRVGPGVRRVKEGDSVVLHWRPASGIQSETPVYDWNSVKVNAGWLTTFNEEAVVSENRLTVIPESFDLKLAPLFGCSVTTAVGVINHDAQLGIGQSVVVLGVGGVGLNIVQAACMVSAWPVVAVDIIESKLEMAQHWGASHGFHSTDREVLKQLILEAVGSRGSDVVIDTTGNSRMIELAYDLTHSDGKTILVGVPKLDDPVQIHTLPLHFKKVLKGSHGGNSVPDVDIPRLIRLINQGLMKLDGMFTHQLGLNDINDAIALLRSGQAGRILIDMGNT